MIPNQRIYMMVLFALIGSYLKGIEGLVFGLIIGYIIGKVLPWNL